MLFDDSFILNKLEEELSTYPENEDEVTQHLAELGYLQVLQVNSLTQSQIENALQKFEMELFASGLYPTEELSKERILGKTHFYRYFLRRLTDIDEGIKFDEFPPGNNIGLRSRIIHYRLDLFGLWEHSVGLPFNFNSISRIEQLAQFAKCSQIEAINYLSDIEEFTKHILKVYTAKELTITFISSQATDEQKRKLDNRNRFSARLEEEFGEDSPYLDELNDKVFRRNERKIDYGFLQKESTNSFKKFLLRIMQIHQWQEGFYDGLLDSNIGKVTIDSLLTAIDSYNETDRKDIRPDRFITYLGNNFFMFNARFFLREYTVEETTANEEKIWESLSDSVKQANSSEQSKIQENINKLKNEIFSGGKLTEKKGLLRRVYYGIKKMLKKASRLIGKIKKWIISGLQKVWGFLKKLFGNFFEKLRDGIKAFIAGLKFLLGKKLILTGDANSMCISKFTLDADSTTLILGKNFEQINKHIDKSKYQMGAMVFSLAVTGSILKIVMQSINLLAWPFLLFSIVKCFNTVKEHYKNINTLKS